MTATAVVIAVGAGLYTVAAPTATAATGPAVGEETVLPPMARTTPRHTYLYEAGATGFTRTQDGLSGLQWTDYATGETRAISGGPDGHSGLRARQAEPAADGSRSIALTDRADGTVVTVTMPAGYTWTGAYAKDSVVAHRTGEDGTVSELAVLTAAAGRTEARPVTGLPAGYTRAATQHSWQDTRGAVLRLTKPGGSLNVLVEHQVAEATATELPAEFNRTGTSIRLYGRHLLTYTSGNAQAVTVDRRDPTVAPVTTTLPPPADAAQSQLRAGAIGDWLVYRHTGTTVDSGKLRAVPIGGGAPRELLAKANAQFVAAPDGSVLAVGGSSSQDWAVRRITEGADGAPELSKLLDVQPVSIRVEQLLLGAGKLAYVSAQESSGPALYEHEVSAGAGAPELSERKLNSRLNPGPDGAVHALGNGRYAYSDGTDVLIPVGETGFGSINTGPIVNRIVDATGRYVVMDTDDGMQQVGDLEHGALGRVVLTRPQSAATIWGSTLWSPGKTAGSILWHDVKSGKKSPDLAIGSGCVPTELQAVGRWIHWSCVTRKAGVWDQKTRKSTPVPVGKSKLGDGFLVHQDGTKLRLSDFHQGTGTAKTTDIADIPAGAPWAVDKFGGGLAYTDAQQAVHVRRVNVPKTPVGVAETMVSTSAYGDATPVWKGTWQLTRPPARWSVTIKNAAGTTVRTIASTVRHGAVITTNWDGKDTSGKPVFGGKYTWTLNADSGEGDGLRAVGSGAFDLSRAATPFRDYDGNGVPELLTKQSTDLVAHEQLVKTASAGAARTTSKGWTDANHIVPMGDMTGDRCNDTVVRNAKGELYRYSGACKGIPTPKSPKTRIGAGFNAFNPPLSAGDLTGDGRTDLLARVRTTNDLYLYADNGTGGLKAGVKLPGSWKGLTLIGAGDLTGDGHGDLLARDAGGELWRYNGTGKGGFTAKTLVFKDWGAGRNAFVGAGDLNGDRKNDLVSRDAAGKLLRNLGDGKGSFGGTVQIGTGWQRYLGLY
ncbi:FG-GAP-like repeat-containing protein [Streptomyces sp. NPDC020965]|uniref:FG-GAP-like repeat-containing protein n=1 Tax=Streptomyces sp. NPDC020965 TaxID=3365105 RepID=UPI0037B9D6C9